MLNRFHKRQIRDFLFIFVLVALGFCLGATCSIYANRNNFFKENDKESYINGYVQACKDISYGSFQILDDSTIVVYPLRDSIIQIVIKNQETDNYR